MNVFDLLKHKGEIASKYHQAIIQKMPNSIRGYWDGFLDKTVSMNSNSLQPLNNSLNTPPLHANDDQLNDEDLFILPAAKEIYESLSAQIGQDIHTGDWLCVSQTMIDKFAEVTGDKQWIHVDVNKAAELSPFKTTIAHGFLTLSLLPLLTDSINEQNHLFPTAKLVVNLGLNQVRFPYPIKSNANIRARTRLTKVTPIRKGLEIEREIKIDIEGIRRAGAIVSSVVQVHF